MASLCLRFDLREIAFDFSRNSGSSACRCLLRAFLRSFLRRFFSATESSMVSPLMPQGQCDCLRAIARSQRDRARYARRDMVLICAFVSSAETKCPPRRDGRGRGADRGVRSEPSRAGGTRRCLQDGTAVRPLRAQLVGWRRKADAGRFPPGARAASGITLENIELYHILVTRVKPDVFRRPVATAAHPAVISETSISAHHLSISAR